MMDKTAMVSIDFWDTLVDGNVGGDERREARHKAIYKVSNNYGKTIKPEQIEAASRKASEEFTNIWFSQQRTPKTAELVTKMLNNLAIPAGKMEYDYLIQQFEESLMVGPPALLDGVEEAIHSLSEKYELTIISDTMYSPGRVLRNYLKEHGLLKHFNGFLFSDEAGFSKPNPKAFQKMLRETKCSPANSYHIGDRLNTDIAGAKAVGMNAVLFTGVSLKSNGVETEIEPDHHCDTWKDIQSLLLEE